MRRVFFGLLSLSGIYLALAQNAEDYKITSLPGIDLNSLNFTQYAGHIEISSEHNSNVFFWMIEREEKTEPEKLIIWLNGGPGCSSMDGLFLENGPYRVNQDMTLNLSEGGWHNYATSIYIDQPVGTGFSFANTDSYMHNMDQIADEFVQFIDKLFAVFPNLEKQDMYIAGESFAGTYIPYFAQKILELNKKDKNYNLQGLAIGNGWISAEHQYNAYYDFSVKNNLIDADRLPIISQHLKTCQEMIKSTETVHINSCERILSDIMDGSTHENKQGNLVCMNMYDIRLKEEPSPDCGLTWPYELADVTKYLRLPEVKQAIHAENQKLGWKECTSLVSIELNGDQSKPAYHLLPDILKEIPILLFSGEYDLICNSLGTEYLIGNMTWNGSRGFRKKAKKQEWRIENKMAGYYTQDRNLTYVWIKDGSHMVPYDRPIECLDMMNRFMNVGNNVVKGRESWVGEKNDKVVPSSPPTKTQPASPVKSHNSSSDSTGKEGDNLLLDDDSGSETVEEPYSQYYNWGTSSLIVVILFAITLCYCWYRSNKKPSAGSAAAEFGGAPVREREGARGSRGLLGFVKRLFKSNKAGDKRKFRLGDNDESNELDELVIETPTLFEAEPDSDEDEMNHTQKKNHSQQHHSESTSTHFAIDDEDDEDDDDFEDFADFNDGENLTTGGSKKFNNKRRD